MAAINIAPAGADKVYNNDKGDSSLVNNPSQDYKAMPRLRTTQTGELIDRTDESKKSMRLNDIYHIPENSLDLFYSKPYAFVYDFYENRELVLQMTEAEYDESGTIQFNPRSLRGDGATEKYCEPTRRTFYLPINPSNLTVSTSFANSLTPTLYGTVEERSRVRYHRIDIQGTTGTVAKWRYNDNTDRPEYVGGRGSYTAGFAQSILNTANSLTGGLADKVLGGAVSSINGLVGSLVGKTPKEGYKIEESGYRSFHDLYRFLLRYQQEAARGQVLGGLKFQIIKDRQEYRVSPQTFTLVRDATQPMMYNYSISMTGYELSNLDSRVKGGPANAYDMRKILGLDGVESSGLYSRIKNTVGSSTRALGAIGGLFR